MYQAHNETENIKKGMDGKTNRQDKE